MEEELSGGGTHYENNMHRAIDAVCARPPRNPYSELQLKLNDITQRFAHETR